MSTQTFVLPDVEGWVAIGRKINGRSKVLAEMGHVVTGISVQPVADPQHHIVALITYRPAAGGDGDA